ncbi:hypothetical protein ORV05_08425 [Amycolatopsis cynarae]|uniref:Uncharacterized protein n=1 Tax=Amycolatopsis cynarae TaxID=2995223 RepID=A0ABY7B9F2_9PSEU|nr:hypothetical protein [Amycolatopsis sp. HUAS 11-8]WAL67783.1 hypothetical protein ORV05_08425 [Amycolatopsis sp. HUAS 11-8]
MGERDDGVAKHSPAVAHNEVSGVVCGSVVQANSILGNVVVTTETATRRSSGPGLLPGLDEWAESLAQGVQKLLRREEAHRRVHDPETALSTVVPMWSPAEAV